MIRSFGFVFFRVFSHLSQTNDYDSTLSKITQLCNQCEGTSEHGCVTFIPLQQPLPLTVPSQSLVPTLHGSLPQPVLSDTDLTVYDAMLEIESKSLK